MLNCLIIFFAAAFISLLGSLQLGPVNLFVINTTIQQSKKHAVWVAIGGIIPEFIYSSLAIFGSSFFIIHQGFIIYFKLVFIFLLVLLGGLFLFKKNLSNNEQETTLVITKINPFKCFIKGFSLAAFNPQLLPFWLLVITYFNTTYLLKLTSNCSKLSFIIGTGFGALILLFLIIFIVNRNKNSIMKYINNRYYYKIIAVVFFGIALQQIITLI